MRWVIGFHFCIHPAGRRKSGLAGYTPWPMSGFTTWRDVGACRVRLASLTDGAFFQLFLTDEEQFDNLLLWKKLLRSCREKLWDGEMQGQWVQVWGCEEQLITD